MSSSLQLRATISPLWPSSKNLFAAVSRRLLCRRRSPLPFVSLTLQSHSDAGASSTSEPSHSHLTSSVGSSLHPSHWNLTHRHISLLSMPLLACQDITQGVRSSTRTVRVAEERL